MTEIVENKINQVNSALDAVDAALQSRVAELEQQLEASNEIRTALVKEKSELELNLSNTQYGRTKAEDALEQFKETVIDVAMDEADKRGWCDEIETLLRERLDLHVQPREATTTVTVTLSIQAAGRRAVFDNNDPDYALGVTEYYNGNTLEVSSQVENLDVTSVEIQDVSFDDWYIVTH